MDAAGEQRPEFRPEQEVRLAVVMYGGVSLAIYINGVAQELFRLVRATAPEEPFSDEEDQRVYFPTSAPYHKRKALDGSERVYRTLGQILNLTGAPDAVREETAGKPVRTRFVIDIISGTSAGGINGVFLGTAIANQQEFAISADLWRKVADIEALLLDEESSPRSDPMAQSLLNGDQLYCKAREAMSDMAVKEEDPGDKFAPSYADQLDLAVTATDLGGLPMPIRLSDEDTVLERNHRTVFRFTYGSAGATGEKHSDFVDTDLVLAFAARATSSFPVAFEPARLEDVRKLGYNRGGDAGVDVERYFPEHRRADLSPDSIVFGDGGYLDNKPFSYATEALRRRRADVPVQRKLVYIEPHPTDEMPAKALPKPDVLDSLKASLSLPRQETIREDIAAVEERNFVVDRIRELGLEVERTLDVEDALEILRDPPARPDPVTQRVIKALDASHAAYLTIRVRTVLDALARVAAQLVDASPDGDFARATRHTLREWIEGRPRNHDALLTAYDAAFEQRRLSFLHDRINDLLRGEERAVRMLAAANLLGIKDVPDDVTKLQDQGDALRGLKRRLNDAIVLLRRAGRAPYAKNPDTTLNPDPNDDERRDPDAYNRFRAVRDAVDELPASANAYMTTMATFLEKPLEQARKRIRGTLEPPLKDLEPWIAELLRAYHDRFEAFDMVVLPLAYPDLGETNAVDILRISPLDAKEIAPQAAGDDVTSKLAGIRMMHFGGFLARASRDNDLLWGRLDGAEAIIHALLGEHDDLRSSLRIKAQAAILREELKVKESPFLEQLRGSVEREVDKTLDEADDDALVDAFKRVYTLPEELPYKKRLELAGRSAGVVGRVLGDGAQSKRLPRPAVGAIRTLLPSLARTAIRMLGLRSRLRRAG